MPEDEFEIYLTLLAKTLRLKDDQRDAIAAELRDHMEQRLHELTDQGLPRGQAIQTALEEFGDASALAKGLTKTNPARRQQRRHLMQTSFGTIAACAAVTFAVMMFTPTNKDGQPTQPGAVAQEAAPGGPEGGTTSFGAAGGFGDEEFGGAGFSSPDGAIREQVRLDLSIHVVDCAEILRAERDTGNLYQRTASLAQAVQNTVATVNEHGRLAIRVQPFEAFLIITATDDAYKEAQKLLEQIERYVGRRSAIETAQEEEQAQLREERMRQRIKLEAEHIKMRARLDRLHQEYEEFLLERQDMLQRHTKDHPEVKQVSEKLEIVKSEMNSLRGIITEVEIKIRGLR